MGKYDKISIIIPSNRRPCLRNAVTSILANKTACPYEIIIVGELPENGIPTDPRIRFLPAAGLGTGALRNLAASEATGTLLLFTDSDCVVDLDWIDRAAASVSETRPVVGGGIRFPEENNWDLGDNLGIFFRMHVSQKPGPAGSLLGTNNLAIIRNVFTAVGGFRDDLTVGEDWEFLNRVRAAGHPLFFDPSFAVLHNSERNTSHQVREHARWYGLGYVKLMSTGIISTGRMRVDHLVAKVPGGASCWSAWKAVLHVLTVYSGHPPFWRYWRACPAVWLFAYTRRKTIIESRNQRVS